MKTLDELRNSLQWTFPYNPAEKFTDGRIELAIKNGVRFSGKRVLEPACHEGRLTSHLGRLGCKSILAFDGRAENAMKALVRLASYDQHTSVAVSRAEEIAKFGQFDLIVHVGLLYHLTHPVEHLKTAMAMAPEILLDTHVAFDDKPLIEHENFTGHWWSENTGSLSGLQPESFWLTKAALESVFEQAGWELQCLLDNANAAVGPRVLYYARRP